MKALSLTTAAALLLIAGVACGKDAPLGTCEASGAKKQTLHWVAGTRDDVEGDFRAKEACTERIVVVQKCAVIKVNDAKKTQKWCHGTDKPSYREDAYTVEYWATDSAD